MNYFEYFSEIEERFLARRGSLLLLSTLDWALIETWREAGVPLLAVLRGIDLAFDRYDVRLSRAKGRLRKVNGLAWCAQAVMEEAVAMTDAALGGQETNAASPSINTGFEAERVARFLEANAAALEVVRTGAVPLTELLQSTAARLRVLAAEARLQSPALDELDRHVTVLEERLQAAVFSSTPEDELLTLRTEADQQLALYGKGMGAAQRRQVRDQFVRKRLLETKKLPRLSLFYMPMDDSRSVPGGN